MFYCVLGIIGRDFKVVDGWTLPGQALRSLLVDGWASPGQALRSLQVSPPFTLTLPRYTTCNK